MWVHDLKKSSWLKDVGGFDFPLFNLNIILYILKFSICLAMFNAIEPKICAAKTLWVALHLLVAMGSSHDLQRARQEAPTKPPSCGATFPRRCAFFGAPFLYVLMRRRILVHLYCRHEWWRNFHWSHACLLFTFRRQVRSSFLKTKRGECVIVSVCVECGDLGNFRKFSVLTVKKNSSFCWIVVFDVRSFFVSILQDPPPYGCFLKWWYPQNTPNWLFLVGKPIVLGYHHFRKPP